MITKYRSSTALSLFLVVALMGCGGGGGSSRQAGGVPDGGGGAGGGADGGGSGGSSGSGTVISGGLVPGGASVEVNTNEVGVTLDVASGGTGATVDLVEINQLGSIVIDGRVIDTDSAVFLVEGQTGSQADLRQGQAVQVISDASGTTANGVHYRSNIKGPATAVNIIDPAQGSAELTVLGQTVRTGATTTFSNVDVAALNTGEHYEISGFLSDAGVIEASFVELKSSLAEYKVLGTVTNLTATTFTVGTLQVDYTSATLIQDSGSALSEGDVVEVRGPANNFTTPDQFVATEVEELPTLTIGNEVPVQLDGYVDRFTSATDFDVQSIPVTTVAATSYLNGDASSISLGTKVIVLGAVQSDGIIRAASITIQPTSAVRAEGPVESIDTTARTITVLGLSFSIRDVLRLEDKSSADLDPLTLADIGVDDEVEVRGFIDGSDLIATRIERDDPRDRARLRGPLSSEDPAGGTVTVLGVTLSSQNGVTEFQDAQDNVLSAAQFFDLTEVGSFIQGEWDIFSDTSQPVDELSLESDD